jgi:flagellar hook-associated protein 3 FlgL
MSGSLTSVYDSVSYAMALHGRAITQLQEQASTGNRVNRASDSSADAYRILGLNSQKRSLAGYKDNVAGLTGNLEVSTTIISDMASELSDVRTLLTQIVGGIYNTEGQKRIADKLNNSLEQLLSLANTKNANQYLFGGNDTGSAPYEAVRNGTLITQVRYRGSDEARTVEVAPGLDFEACRVGDTLFRSDDRGDPVFLGSTGAAAGTGTSSVQGDVWLTVENDGTGYRLSIDDGASFVNVSDGDAANLPVKDSRTGRVLYVDATGIQSTGVELVRTPGTYDVFGTLISLRDLLLNEKGLSTQDLVDVAGECVAAVEEVQNLLVQAEVSTGSKIAFLNTLGQNLDNTEYATDDETSRLQEADIAQISIDLSRQEILYQMSLSVAGRLLSTSLLDYID